MKTDKFFKFLTLAMCAFAFAFVTGCEGPEGPQGPAGPAGADGADGANGIDGVDANETCKECHNETTTVLVGKSDEFVRSGHAMGTYYNRGGECAACHNNEGFLARVDYTSASDIYSYTGPAESAISCYTCHGIHQTYTAGDWALTLTDQVTEAILGTKTEAITSAEFLDYGNGNMCLQCHQSRDRGNVPVPGQSETVNITSSHWGPHYGVQGNVLQSSGGVDLVGDKSYPTGPDRGHGKVESFPAACITCHMDGGDHTLTAAESVCAECHTDVDDLVEDLEKEIHDDLFALGAELATQGYMTVNYADEAETIVAGYSPKVVDNVPAAQASAVWNYMVVYQDHSYGVHNPTYIRALIANSMQAITQ